MPLKTNFIQFYNVEFFRVDFLLSFIPTTPIFSVS